MPQRFFQRYVLGSYGVALSLLISGCGGGSEEAAPDASASASSGESGKSGPPTVKGLGASAKDRQKDIDSGAQGAGPDQNAMREAMSKQMGGPDGGMPPGGGGYVPEYVQGAQGPQGGQGAPQPEASPSGLMETSTYAGFGGAGNGVLLADNAFIEGGEALNANQANNAQGPGGAGANAVQEDYSSPDKAVESFLSAVASKDPEVLSRSVSRYASSEAKNATIKKVFTGIIDKSLSTEDMDALTDAFVEYKVVNATLTKNSGSVNVTIGREITKNKGQNARPEFERRILRVHRDGARGWRVVDFGNKIVQ